jgi:SOS-response transcriptional repressor LexA
MMPTLKPGQLILVDFKRPPRVGDVVVAVHPAIQGEIVKRLNRIDGPAFWLEGDGMDIKTAESSTDSWVVGDFRRDQILGVVIWPSEQQR